MTTNTPTPAAPAARLRLEFLDGLRGLAALSVLFSHMWLESWPVLHHTVHPQKWVWIWTGWAFYGGRFAVDLFITLSGFCLMLPVVKHGGVLRGGAWQFFKRRAQRILPTFYLAAAFSVSLIWLFVEHGPKAPWNTPAPLSGMGVASCLLMLQDIFHFGEVNGAFWSVAVEWRIYFLFPLLVLCARRFGMHATAASTIALSGMVFLVMHRTPLLMPYQVASPQYLALFVLGILAAYAAFSDDPFWAKRRASAWWLAAAILLFACVEGLCAHWDWEYASQRFGVLDFAVGASAFGLLLSTSVSEASRVRRALSWKPMVVVGTFSYSIYLVHAPLIQLVWLYLVRPLHANAPQTFFLLTVVGTPLIVAASYLFFLVAEKRFLPGHPRTERQVVAATVREPAI